MSIQSRSLLILKISWNMTINIDTIEVVIDTEDNWNMTINIDSDRGRY